MLVMSCVIIEIVFCNSQLFASMQSPVSGKLKGQKIPYSVNESPIAKIKDIMKYNKYLQSPEASKLTNNLGRLQESASGSKQKISRTVVHFVESQLLHSCDRTLGQENNRILHAYTDSAKNKKKSAVKAMECAVANLPIASQHQYCAINTNHVLYPRPIKSCATNRCIGVSGGHNIDKYLDGELDIPCVLTENKIKGVFVNVDDNSKISKTVDSGFEGEDIIKAVRKSTLVATIYSNKDPLKIVKTSKGDFYGMYIDVNNPLICKTQFPLLIVDGDLCDKQKGVIVATLANLTTDYKSVRGKHTLSVSSETFDKMMQNSKFIRMEVQDIVMKDITRQIELQFQSALCKKGYHQGRLPGPIYGIKKVKP